MRQRFHWPGMRDDIRKWIKGCPHCIESNIWRKRSQELHFSWPVTSPFYIMHIDLWQPGNLVDASGKKSIYLTACVISLNSSSLMLLKTQMQRSLPSRSWTMLY